jgi:hypothetical protein
MNTPPAVVATIIQPLWRKNANLDELEDICERVLVLGTQELRKVSFPGFHSSSFLIS